MSAGEKRHLLNIMLRPFESLRTVALAASDGEIGSVREFYFDDEHWTVRYLVVNTGSWLAGREVLIPTRALGEVDPQGRFIAVHLTREQVRESPPLYSDKPISRQHEEELHQYYGWDPYWMGGMGDLGAGMMLPPSALAPPPAFAPPPELSQDEPSQTQKIDSHLQSSAELVSGYTIHAQDGEIGRVEDFILDDSDWRVRYLVVHTGAWFLGKNALLAPEWIDRISYEDAEVVAHLPRSAIKGAPEYRAREPLTREFEQRLHDHYGRTGYWEGKKTGG